VIVREKPSTSSLSIVIPTYKRERRLCETVQALVEIRGGFLELLIVDQTPEHLPETKSFLAQLPACVRLIRMPHPNLPAARNAGAREAAGDVVLYLDDDIKPLPELFEAHTRHYGDHTVGGVAGRLLSPYGEVKRLDPRYYTSPFQWRYIRFDQDWDLREVESAPGGNMSYRRHLIFEAGGFDEHFVGNAFREETDFCLRLRKRSYRILFDPDAAVIHYWKTEGGCDHIRLGNPQLVSFSYYQDFIQNNFYFFLKHVPPKAMWELTWELYRNHIGNKSNLDRGFGQLCLRHVAFFVGFLRAYSAWQRLRS
jgi:GT2 family glycosyltransferase